MPDRCIETGCMNPVATRGDRCASHPKAYCKAPAPKVGDVDVVCSRWVGHDGPHKGMAREWPNTDSVQAIIDGVNVDDVKRVAAQVESVQQSDSSTQLCDITGSPCAEVAALRAELDEWSRRAVLWEQRAEQRGIEVERMRPVLMEALKMQARGEASERMIEALKDYDVDRLDVELSSVRHTNADLKRTVERMRPVVEACESWVDNSRDVKGGNSFKAMHVAFDAVDAYREVTDNQGDT